MDLKSDDQSGGAYKGAFAAEAADEVVSQHACSSLPLLHVHGPPPLHPEPLTSDVMSTLVFEHGEAEQEVGKEASQQVSSEEILTAEPISECELMTEEEYRRANLESKTADESASAGVDSGSSMHRVLPALIAISSVSSANHVAAFDRGRHDSSSAVRGRHQHDSHYESQGQVAAEKAYQVQEGPHTVPGEVRLPAGGRTRHEGRPSPGLPMLRPTCCDGRREGQLVGPQQAWPMDSLQPVQTENSICAGLRCHRGTASGWSLGTRLGHSGVHGEGQDRGRPLEKEKLNSKACSSLAAEVSLRQRLEKLEADRKKKPPQLRPGEKSKAAPSTPPATAQGYVTEVTKKAVKRESEKTAEKAEAEWETVNVSD